MRNSTGPAPSLLLLTTIVFGCGPTSRTVDQPAADDVAAEAAVSEVSFANTKCPIMGGKPTVELTAEYEGKTIGFCCDGCPQKWAALSDEERAEKFAAVQVDGDGSTDADTQQDSHADAHASEHSHQAE